MGIEDGYKIGTRMYTCILIKDLHYVKLGTTLQ